MNDAKCAALKEELATEPEPQVVAAERFFDGNDDLGSIGCNLDEHPGVDVFQNVFARLLQRPDVQAIYARIAELDPGEGCWPYTDTILVVGKISEDELREAVSELQPTDVGKAKQFAIPPAITQKYGSQMLVVFWD